MRRIFIPVACLCLLASCSGGNDDAYRVQQARIDSAVNARVTRHDAENSARNDSVLTAIEQEKADSITRAKHVEQKPDASQ